MAPKKDERHKVQLEFNHDRLLKDKLLQAYAVLVPVKLKGLNRSDVDIEKAKRGSQKEDENSSDILTRFV